MPESSTAIADRLEVAAKHARKVKDDRVRSVRGRRGETDILIVVEAWRGTDVVAVALVPLDRDLMLHVARMWCVGLGADMVVLTLETFFGCSGKNFNPDTGTKWGANEMGVYFERHGPENGVVSEGLYLTAFNRAGDEAAVSLPYRVVGRSVEWGSPAGGSDPAIVKTGGKIPDAMRCYMSEPTILQQAAQMGYRGPGAEAEIAFTDTATVKTLGSLPPDVAHGEPVVVLMFAEPSSVRHRVLREAFGRAAVQDPREWE